MTKKVGVLIPTLFTRNDYLKECIASVRSSGDPYILLMGPMSPQVEELLALVDGYLEEPAKDNLAAKIDFGLRALPKELPYFTWIGDDDLLEGGSMDRATLVLERAPSAAMAFGGCRYIDSRGVEIGTNKSGSWAIPLMRFGPFLAPQPGSLYRREFYELSGGLDSEYRFAFDYALTLKLIGFGRALYLRKVQSSFRWHEDSLSVKMRSLALREAENIRLDFARGKIETRLVIALNRLVTPLALAAARVLTWASEKGSR